MELFTGQNRHIEDIGKFTNEINKLDLNLYRISSHLIFIKINTM